MNKLVKIVLGLLLCAMAGGAAETAVSPGWLKAATRDLALEVRHEGMKPGARRDAGELVLMVMRELVRGGFTVHISREYLAEEIAYYEAFAKEERYPVTSGEVLACLRMARETGTFDWDSFRKIAAPADDPIAIYDYFPWLSPPNDPGKVRLESTNAVAMPRLRLVTRWDGLQGKGYAGIAGREVAGARFREGKGIGLSGDRTYWRFAAALRLNAEGQAKFEKFYLWEPWRTNAVNYHPVAITGAKVMDDLRRGLDFAWEAPAGKGKKKKR